MTKSANSVSNNTQVQNKRQVIVNKIPHFIGLFLQKSEIWERYWGKRPLSLLRAFQNGANIPVFGDDPCDDWIGSISLFDLV